MGTQSSVSNDTGTPASVPASTLGVKDCFSSGGEDFEVIGDGSVCHCMQDGRIDPKGNFGNVSPRKIEHHVKFPSQA